MPDATALVKGAPHKDNAQRFLDFTVSYEVQHMLSESSYRRSVRKDVSAGKSLLPLDRISLVEYDVEWACRNRDVILSDWSFYLKGAE